MNQPLYIQDFSFHSVLGHDKAQVFDKLIKGVRGDFSTLDHGEEHFCVANIDTTDFPAPENPYYNERVNRLAEISLRDIEQSVQATVAKYGADRVGVFIGSCDNGSEISINALRYKKQHGEFPAGYSLCKQKADFPLEYIMSKFGIHGPCALQSTACGSSATAIATARHSIYVGDCDAAIIGGVDIASLAVVLGFNSLGAVSATPTIPFSKNRAGITLGDGSAFFVVTKEPGNAKFKITGIGESADADHITAPRADGEGARLAMAKALDDACLKPSDIDYINLHGTGTRLNDSMEGTAVHKIFGTNVPCSSTKALTGHTLGTAGALELGFCCLVLSDSNPEGFLPAHLYDGEFDPEIPEIRLVRPGDSCKGIRRIQSNSFAFGGCNVSLIVEKV